MKLRYKEWSGSSDASVLGRWSLFFGPEEHLKREALARVRAEVSPGEEPTWETLEGRGLAASDLLNRCQTGALFGGARIVVVQRAERIDGDEQDALAKAVGPLPPGVAVVLVTWESTAGGRRRRLLRAPLQRAIEKQGLAIQFPSLSAREAATWAISRAKEMGKKLEPAAARKLAEQKVGTGLGELLCEVEKLTLYVGGLDIISGAHVDAVSPRLLEEDVWRLIDAVGRQQTGRAVAILRGLLRNRGEGASRTLGLLARTMRLIWQTKLLVESGWRAGQEVDEETARLLPQDDRKNALAQFARRSWLVQRTAVQARAFTWGRLARAMHALLNCDLCMKGIAGKIGDEAVALELLVVQLCTDVAMPVWESPVGGR